MIIITYGTLTRHITD